MNCFPGFTKGFKPLQPEMAAAFSVLHSRFMDEGAHEHFLMGRANLLRHRSCGYCLHKFVNKLIC